MINKLHAVQSIFLSRILSMRSVIKLIHRKNERIKSFIFNGIKLDYFYHSYNNHRLTERTVEIPIIKHYIEITNPGNILEIGNVTNHYYTYFSTFKIDKTVVDKYEKAFGVINEDIISFSAETKFDLVISISTFEHMDFNGRGNYKSSHAVDACVHVCENLLSNGGYFILTIPVGQNIAFDAIIFNGELDNKLSVDQINYFYLKRTGEIQWKQISPNLEINTLIVIVIKK